MKFLRTQAVVLTILSGSIVNGYGQTTNARRIATCDSFESDTSCCNCANIKLKLSQRIGSDGASQNGVLYKGCFWRCRVCRTGTALTFSLGNGDTPGPVLDLYCEDTKSSEPFNNSILGRKDGIWLQCNMRSRIVTSATFYQKGEKLKEVIFWPNGQPQQVTLYSNRKRRKTGSHRYAENGYVISTNK